MNENPTIDFSPTPSSCEKVQAFNVEKHDSNETIIIEVDASKSTETLLSYPSENLDLIPLTNVGFKEDIQHCTLYDKFDVLLRETVVQHSNAVVEHSNAVVQHSNSNTADRSSNQIFHILNATYEGNFMIACYDFESVEENKLFLLQSKKRTYFSKNKVARIIIDYEIYRTNQYHISSERLLQLAKLISELFPKCLLDSFYTQGSADRSAGGALQSYYGKLREKEIAIGRLKLQKRKRISNSNDVEDSEGLKQIKTQVAIIDDAYIKLWRETAVSERKEIYMKKNDLTNIVKALPNFTHPAAYTLIQEDFKIIFHKSSDLFFENWAKVTPKIVKLAIAKKADPIIKKILSENNPIKGDVHEKTLALILLPLLFKRTAKVTAKSLGRISWTPQKNETLQSFIIHLNDTDKLQERLKEAHSNLVKVYSDHGLMPRPYVVICGQSLADIKHVFVIAEPIKYQLTTPLDAIDICFQLMKIFNQPYSSICNHVWQFMERKMYEFDVKSLFGNVTTLIEKLY